MTNQNMPYTLPKLKTFGILFALGLIGVISLIWLPLPTDLKTHLSPIQLHLAILVNPIILLTIAVLAGTFTAPKVGLKSPTLLALHDKTSLKTAIAPQLIPGIIGGIIGGFSLIGITKIATPYLPQIFVTQGKIMAGHLPLAVRLLYGGITEEILLRWGMMSLIIWILWKLFKKADQSVGCGIIWTGIIISALLFGAGHLPLAFKMDPNPSIILISYLLGANGLFGLIAGWLYWKKGLECGMIAHMTAHIIMVTFGM